jgi:hypothetical protein
MAVAMDRLAIYYDRAGRDGRHDAGDERKLMAIVSNWIQTQGGESESALVGQLPAPPGQARLRTRLSTPHGRVYPVCVA